MATEIAIWKRESKNPNSWCTLEFKTQQRQQYTSPYSTKVKRRKFSHCRNSSNSKRTCVRSPIPVEHPKIKPKKGDRTCNIERDNGCLLTASCKWQKQKRKFSHCRRSRATGKSNVQEHQFPLSNAQSNSRTCTSACSIERDEARHKNRRLEKFSLQT